MALVRRVAFGAAFLLCGIGLASTLTAHGDVTPQAVDTSSLPDLPGGNNVWVKSNPYRADPQVMAAAVKVGQSAYGGNCARCHGLEGISGGIAPDLRYLEKGDAGDEWYVDRYQHGAVRDGKVYMPAFGETLGQKAGWAIRTWLETKHQE